MRFLILSDIPWSTITAAFDSLEGEVNIHLLQQDLVEGISFVLCGRGL